MTYDFERTRVARDDLNEPVDVVLEDRCGRETGAVVRVLRAGSKVYLKIRDQQSGKRMRPVKVFRGRIAGYVDTPPSAEQEQGELIETLATCTVGWSGLHDAGKPFAYSHENALALYERSPLVRKQIDDAVHSVEYGWEDVVAAGFYSKGMFAAPRDPQQKRRRYDGPNLELARGDFKGGGGMV